MDGSDFLRMFAYDHWANPECLRAIRKSSPSAGDTNLSAPVRQELVKRIAHILSAEKLWLERIRQERQSMPVWPDSTIEECEALADKMASAWKIYLGNVSKGELDKTFEYRNSKGEAWSSRVEDVLLHVIMHSTYHRGQIATQMRRAGMDPPLTDFIHAVRSGFVD
jgi:uncharacterized damage-inducible protein DinB